MKNPKTLKKLAVYSLVAFVCGAGQTAYGHTNIRNLSSNATEGVITFHNLNIGHGCTDAKGKDIPVTAQSVVFPSVNPILTINGTPAGLSLSDILTSSTGLAGITRLVQSKDIFKKQSVKTANGNIIGFNSTVGKLDPALNGLVPFLVRGDKIIFKSPTTVEGATDSCVTKLEVTAAIADICKKTFPPTPVTANLWMPDITADSTKFKDATIDGIGSPGAPLVIERDLDSNPLDGSCGGNGKTVTVTPSAADIDANLPIPGSWGR